MMEIAAPRVTTASTASLLKVQASSRRRSSTNSRSSMLPPGFGRSRMRRPVRQLPFFSAPNFARLRHMPNEDSPIRDNDAPATEGAPAMGAEADPSGYVWDPRGFYWHPIARHWYEPYSRVYYSEDGQVLPAERAQADLARAMGWEVPAQAEEAPPRAEEPAAQEPA